MAKFLRILFFILAAFISQSMGFSSATSKVVDEEAKNFVSSNFAHHASFDAVHFHNFLDAELLNNISQHASNSSRVQRVQLFQYFFSLRNLLLYHADRAASLSRQQVRAIDFTSNIYPSSDYYVFALRKIII